MDEYPPTPNKVIMKTKLDYSKYTQKDVFWATLDNYDGSSSLSQHGYVDKYPGTEDKGNLSLCGRYHGWDGGNDRNNANEIGGERMNEHCCKICRKIYNRLEQ